MINCVYARNKMIYLTMKAMLMIILACYATYGSEYPIRDAANSNETSRVVDGLSCDGCMKSCFKKCGKSKSKTGLACWQMTVTKWSCGCCCSKD
ncbi:hypothetical protein MKW94_001841 [Papaver nudicaule]|uniref:Uncharacterized protein n=1 Tax=Papaver nudicaule TaxID=74823 RepID=A0AA41W2G9_PAPNU|nr:hypothetical protein [Papaver nudicaule]